MRGFFYKEAINKVMDYRKRYPESPLLCSLKMGLYGILWFLKNMFYIVGWRGKNKGRVKVAFVLSNMIGDVLINLVYISQFRKKVGDEICIDVYFDLSEEVAFGLMYGKNFVNNIYCKRKIKLNEYDLAVKLVRYPELLYISDDVNRNFNDFISVYIKTIDNFGGCFPFFFVNRYGDRLGIEYAKLNGKKRYNQGDINNLLDLESATYLLEVDLGFKAILEKYKIREKMYITVQRGIAGNGEYTRMWSCENYEKLLGLIRKDFPWYKFVQVGRSDTKKIKNIDIDLRGKTSFEELKNVLKFSYLHIDGDCGMVHIRHFLSGGPSVVFFGPTDQDFLGYQENINLRSNRCSNFCEWIKISWQEKCIMGYSENLPCMVSADEAYNKIKTIL